MSAGRGNYRGADWFGFRAGRLASGRAVAERLGCGDGVGEIGCAVGGRVSGVRVGVGDGQ